MNKYNNYLIIVIVLFLSSCHKNHNDQMNIDVKNEVLKKFDYQICKDHNDYHHCYTKWFQEEREINGKKVVCIPSLNAYKYIDTLNPVHFDLYWKKSMGHHKKSWDSNKEPQTFVNYSDTYLRWLTQYSKTDEGNWVIPYLEKYQLMRTISPSVIATFDQTLLKEDLNNNNIRLIALIHHLTLSYNYCQE